MSRSTLLAVEDRETARRTQVEMVSADPRFEVVTKLEANPKKPAVYDAKRPALVND